MCSPSFASNEGNRVKFCLRWAVPGARNRHAPNGRRKGTETHMKDETKDTAATVAAQGAQMAPEKAARKKVVASNKEGMNRHAQTRAQKRIRQRV
jgi:hypothetical protein